MLALPMRLEPHRRGVHRLLDHLFVDQRFGIPPLRFRDLELIEECNFMEPPGRLPYVSEETRGSIRVPLATRR